MIDTPFATEVFDIFVTLCVTSLLTFHISFFISLEPSISDTSSYKG